MPTPSNPPARSTHIESIPLSVPHISGSAWEYLRDCLDTNWVSSVGGYVDRFEQLVAQRLGKQFGVATVNGTAALHTALLLAGIQPGDEVLVSSLTFIAPANAIRYVGAFPVPMDAEARYAQIDPERVADFLQHQCLWQHDRLLNRDTRRPVTAIIPVHILGHPVDMNPLAELADRYRLAVIEDAAECLGAYYRGRPAGQIGDLACTSFNGNKIVTCGGGGVLATDNPEVARQARHLTTQARSDETEMIHDRVGYNYRLTNIQAALGCSQMELLDQILDAKHRIAKNYVQSLDDIPGVTPLLSAPWAESNDWMPTILVDAETFGIGSRQLIERLASAKIQSRPLWQPMHRSPALSDLDRHVCPVADRLYEQAVSLPCSVQLSEQQQNRVIDVIRQSYRGRSSRAA